MSFTAEDYPLAEHHPDKVQGKRGITISDITLDAVLSGNVTIEDLRITPQALNAQADVARSAGRTRLAANFERASELVSVPQDIMMEIYELLRPGRAKAKEQLLDTAKILRDTYQAERIASFLEEAAEVYETRGLFTKRF
jgi:propanediol dehydratase small subunit